jgi:subtilisin family serine protease
MKISCKIFLVFILCRLFTCNVCNGQKRSSENQNWQNLDLQSDNVFGISTFRAYNDLLKKKVPHTIIVAVIDGGVDITHEDLRDVIWNNPKEIAGNGKDDDGNGYIDDIHGWNFMGNRNGSFQIDNSDLVRSLRMESLNHPRSRLTFKLKAQLESQLNKYFVGLKKKQKLMLGIRSIMENIDNANPNIEQLKGYKYRDENELSALMYIVRTMKYMDQEFQEVINEFQLQYRKYENYVHYTLNVNYNPRIDSKEFYTDGQGNPDVKGLDPRHGTHVSGIIAAKVNNSVGIDGICNSALIMPIRAVPEGDMLDEDIAKSIRYAVDNGAKIINLSVNKSTSPNKSKVDDAVKYAMENDVLIVHAAGNDGQREDIETGFPNKHYINGGEALNWLEVGASGQLDDETLLAKFSNYGKENIDIFAPGVRILSTYPCNKYLFESGTSMAAPVVSGLAALIWAYYPKLKAGVIKNIICRSIHPVFHPVKNHFNEDVSFQDICRYGGIVNAYNAIKLADSLKER